MADGNNENVVSEARLQYTGKRRNILNLIPSLLNRQI